MSFRAPLDSPLFLAGPFCLQRQRARALTDLHQQPMRAAGFYYIVALYIQEADQIVRLFKGLLHILVKFF